MIKYVKAGGAKRPVAERVNAETGKREYCFGLSQWQPSIPKAWEAFTKAQETKQCD